MSPAVDAPAPAPPAPERIDWSPREQPRYLTILMVAAVWALLVVELFVIEVSFVQGKSIPVTGLLILPIFLIVAGLVVWRTYFSEPTRIGISENGLHLEWGSRLVVVPWSFVTPAFLSTRWESYPLFYRVPGARLVNYVFLTPMQARALLNHPDRPAWPVEAKIREKLQLASRA
jgi:hypothetical protein